MVSLQKNPVARPHGS